MAASGQQLTEAYMAYLNQINAVIADFLQASIFSPAPRSDLRAEARSMCDYELDLLERVSGLSARDAWSCLTDIAYRYDWLDQHDMAEQLYKRAGPLKASNKDQAWVGSRQGQTIQTDYFSKREANLAKLMPDQTKVDPSKKWVSFQAYLEESYKYYLNGFERTKRYLVEKGYVGGKSTAHE